MKILIIDDDRTMLSLLNRMLSRKGHEVIEAQDSQQAVGLAQTGKFDLVVVDIFMPDKDGIEVISELRKVNQDIKIIAISGMVQSGVNYLDLAKKLGANKTLVKPFSMEQLENSVNELSA